VTDCLEGSCSIQLSYWSKACVRPVGKNRLARYTKPTLGKDSGIVGILPIVIRHLAESDLPLSEPLPPFI
jgi:hypothetical protein